MQSEFENLRASLTGGAMHMIVDKPELLRLRFLASKEGLLFKYQRAESIGYICWLEQESAPN